VVLALLILLLVTSSFAKDAFKPVSDVRKDIVSPYSF